MSVELRPVLARPWEVAPPEFKEQTIQEILIGDTPPEVPGKTLEEKETRFEKELSQGKIVCLTTARVLRYFYENTIFGPPFDERIAQNFVAAVEISNDPNIPELQYTGSRFPDILLLSQPKERSATLFEPESEDRRLLGTFYHELVYAMTSRYVFQKYEEKLASNRSNETGTALLMVNALEFMLPDGEAEEENDGEADNPFEDYDELFSSDRELFNKKVLASANREHREIVQIALDCIEMSEQARQSKAAKQIIKHRANSEKKKKNPEKHASKLLKLQGEREKLELEIRQTHDIITANPQEFIAVATRFAALLETATIDNPGVQHEERKVLMNKTQYGKPREMVYVAPYVFPETSLSYSFVYEDQNQFHGEHLNQPTTFMTGMYEARLGVKSRPDLVIKEGNGSGENKVTVYDWKRTLPNPQEEGLGVYFQSFVSRLCAGIKQFELARIPGSLPLYVDKYNNPNNKSEHIPQRVHLTSNTQGKRLSEAYRDERGDMWIPEKMVRSILKRTDFIYVSYMTGEELKIEIDQELDDAFLKYLPRLLEALGPYKDTVKKIKDQL